LLFDLRMMRSLLLAVVFGCSSSSTSTDAGPSGADAAEADSGAEDAGDTGADSGAEDAGETRCVTSSRSGEITLPHDAPNGAYDMSVVSRGGRLWASFSGVDGPAGSGRISTHLAYSDDDGATWCEFGVINPSTDVPPGEQPEAVRGIGGHWSHEVSSLAFDEGADEWILVWHRYLHVEDGVPGNEDRQLAYGWIAEKRAATVGGLFDAEERKLFAAAGYDVGRAYNDAAPGGTPAHRFPELADCVVFTEPGILVHEGTRYVALWCYAGADDQRIELVANEGDGWSHRARLLGVEDRVPGVTHRGFNGPALVHDEAAGMRLLVSPVQGGYRGCAAYTVDSDGTLGAAELVVPATESPDVYQSGPCTYAPGSALGVVTGDTYLSVVQFRLFATGTRLD